MNTVKIAAGAPPTTLSRSLKPRHVSMIAIGGIIGAGLFVGSGAGIAAAGPAVVISYVVAGLLALLVMRMLGEMAVALPQVRSFTEFTRAGLGDGAGFVAGWLYWYFWVVVVPLEAIAGANLLHDWLPLPPWELGLGLMALMTAVNLTSARSYGEFEFWFASIKVAAILSFIVVTTSYAMGWVSSKGNTFGNLVGHGGFAPHGALAVAAAVATAFFSITGGEITLVAVAESQEPARAIAKMTSSVMSRILFFYVVSLFLIVSVLPWDSVRPGKSPFTDALRHMHFPWAAPVMSVIILTAVLSCLNSAFYICSRVLFVMAEHGDAPRWLVKLNRQRVPARSVLIGTAAGALGVLVNTLAPTTLFAFLVNASGALMLFIYLMTALAQIRLRRARERAGAPVPTLQMWLFPWLSYVAVAGMLAVLVAMVFTPALASQLYLSLFMLLIVAGAYALTRHVRRKTSSAMPYPRSTSSAL